MAILKAVKRLTWAGQNAVGDHSQPFVDFNEMLSVGYFEDMHMGVSKFLKEAGDAHINMS